MSTSNLLRCIRFDVDALSFDRVPVLYRQSLRNYVKHGLMPGHAITSLLEGNIMAVLSFRDDLPGLLALTLWLHDELPCACWGSPDQVQLWVTFAREQSRAERRQA